LTLRSAVLSICIDCLNISKTLHFTKTQCLYFRILLGRGEVISIYKISMLVFVMETQYVFWKAGPNFSYIKQIKFKF